MDDLSIELLNGIPKIIPAILKILEGAVINRAIYYVKNANCEVNDYPWNAVAELMNHCTTACAHIRPAVGQSITSQLDLMKIFARSAMCITLCSNERPVPIERGIIVPLIVDIFNQQCIKLNVSDAIIISKEEADRILHHILRMDKVVHFSASIESESDMQQQYGSIKVEIDTLFGEQQYVEIKHVNSESFEEHSH